MDAVRQHQEVIPLLVVVEITQEVEIGLQFQVVMATLQILKYQLLQVDMETLQQDVVQQF